MTTKAEQRKARLLALAQEAAKSAAPPSKEDKARDLASRKLTPERFRGMFRTYAAAALYVYSELHQSISHLDGLPSEENWQALYQLAIAVEAQSFSDPQQLAPPERPRKTALQAAEEREWEREVQRMAGEDAHLHSNIGPSKYGSAY